MSLQGHTPMLELSADPGPRVHGVPPMEERNDDADVAGFGWNGERPFAALSAAEKGCRAAGESRGQHVLVGGAEGA